MIKKFWLNFLFSFLSIIVVGASVFAIANLNKYYYNWEHPIGDEVLTQMGKIKFIDKFFPHFNWNHEWDAGQPGFWVYLPFMFFVGSAMVKIFNLTLPHTITIIGLISYILITIGIYGITHRLSKNHLTAIFAAVLAITSQGLWYWAGGGYYARTFGMGFYFLTLWAGIAFIQKLEKQEKFFPLPKLEFFLTIIFFFIAAYSHVFCNYLTVGSLLLLFLVGLSGWRKKILAIVFVIGTSILLSAFYYFLMLQANLQFYSRVLVHRIYEPHPLRLFWNLKVFEGYSGAPEVSPLILPLVALLLLWFIFSRWRFKDFTPVEKRILGLMIFFLIVSLYYPLQGSLFLPKLFYIFMLPCDAPFLVSVFGAILIGILLATLLRNFPKPWHYLVPVILLAIVAFATVQGAFFTLEDKWPRRLTDYDGSGFLKRMVIDPDSRQYRLGTNNPVWGESFNYFYEVPQNRDYFGQGVVYDDWQFWQIAAIWNKDYDYPETDFLLDWYSIKWILSTSLPLDDSYEKFKARPGKYDLIYQENLYYYEFSPKNISPILAATNVPNILVIGREKSAYDLFIRGIALINLNSQFFIPVKGKNYIDQYSLDELKHFDMIYLYDYQYKNKEKASNLLKKYVEQGGGLIVEGMLSPEDVKQENQVLFEPLPQAKIKRLNRLGDWKFEVKDNEITQGVDFSVFDKAIYEETNPWKIVSVEAVNNYQALVKSDGDPVILTSELGKGRIVWMGLNLNYHITANKNVEEMKFFKNIINWVGKGKIDQVQAVEYETKFIHPERREIMVKSQSSGILNKEYYFPAWKAYLEQGGVKKELKIYRGGLDQQYIPLPADLKVPYTVVMVYGRWPAESVGFVVSGVTFIILIIYLFEGIIYPPFIGRVWKETSGRIRFKATSWWGKEEE